MVFSDVVTDAHQVLNLYSSSPTPTPSQLAAADSSEIWCSSTSSSTCPSKLLKKNDVVAATDYGSGTFQYVVSERHRRSLQSAWHAVEKNGLWNWVASDSFARQVDQVSKKKRPWMSVVLRVYRCMQQESQYDVSMYPIGGGEKDEGGYSGTCQFGGSLCWVLQQMHELARHGHWEYTVQWITTVPEQEWNRWYERQQTQQTQQVVQTYLMVDVMSSAPCSYQVVNPTSPASVAAKSTTTLKVRKSLFSWLSSLPSKWFWRPESSPHVVRNVEDSVVF